MTILRLTCADTLLHKIAMSVRFELFVDAFQALGERLLKDSPGWEVRFETPPGAYLHLSKPNWGDDNMDGVHLEAYVSETGECGRGEAVVALHCERGCPGGDRESLITALAQRVQSACEEFPKGASPVLVRGVQDCTVVESRFAFSMRDETEVRFVVDGVEDDLKRLQHVVAPHVDAKARSAALTLAQVLARVPARAAMPMGLGPAPRPLPARRRLLLAPMMQLAA